MLGIPSLRLRFSLLTLFLFMLACGALCGWYARADRQRRAVEAVCGYESWCLYGTSANEQLFGPYERPKQPLVLNLFHSPRVFVGGLSGCSDPWGLFGFSDIEVFIATQALQNVPPRPVPWDSSCELSSLEEVYIGGRARFKVVGDDLPKFRAFRRLQVLCLSDHPLKDDDLIHLHALIYLRHLNLEKTQVTAAGVAKLQHALPQCRIVWK